MQAIAYLAMLGYVPFSFFAYWKWPAKRAAMILMFGAALFLPSNFFGIDPPVLPPLTKELWCPLWALIGCAVMKPSALKSVPFRGPEALVLVMCAGVVGTGLTNGDPVVHGPTVLPALTWYDTLADVGTTIITWFPAYYLGRALFRTEADLHELLRFMVLAAIWYSIPIFIELRISPQFHIMTYGYFPSQFDQVFRLGGYRPTVFFRHGINLALSMTVFTFAAAILYKARAPLGKLWTPGRAFAFLFVIIVLCKSTGAYFHLALGTPLLLFFGHRGYSRAALALCALILSYPLLRLFDLVPVDGIHQLMMTLTSEERANSLWFRLFTEGQILENTRERIIFGWGGYARSTEYDDVTGEPLSILDGYWTAELGQHGLVGWGSVFTMMLLPAIRAARSAKLFETDRARRLVAGSAFLVALYVFDWIPNSSISLDLTFFTGALAGCVPGMLAAQRLRRAVIEVDRVDRESGHARQRPR